jgi:hypothetical protein
MDTFVEDNVGSAIKLQAEIYHDAPSSLAVSGFALLEYDQVSELRSLLAEWMTDNEPE